MISIYVDEKNSVCLCTSDGFMIPITSDMQRIYGTDEDKIVDSFSFLHLSCLSKN